MKAPRKSSLVSAYTCLFTVAVGILAYNYALQPATRPTPALPTVASATAARAPQPAPAPLLAMATTKAARTH